MAALTQHRCLAGTKAFTGLQTRSQPKIANGSKYFMRRRDSYMVEVNVADTETEDQAVRRYMRAVVQSGVLNKLRARRTKETKIEQYKRKLQERAQARKLGIEEPTWEEFYGADLEEFKPFDEFFIKPSGDDVDDTFSMPGGINDMPMLDDGMLSNDSFFSGQLYSLDGYQQTGYMNQDQGGYINQGTYQGGYIQPQPQQQQQQEVNYNYDQLQQQQPEQQPPPQQ